MENVNRIMELSARMNSIEESISNIEKEISRFKIDKQLVVKAEQPIHPGVGCKFQYSAAGLITSVMPLEESDIPQLGVNKIANLGALLSALPTSKEVESLKESIAKVREKGKPVLTGCKVNVDSNGVVTDVMELSSSDIPDIPITKVIGLESTLNQLTASLNAVNSVDFKVDDRSGDTMNTPSTPVVNRKITMADIPQELISMIHRIETEIPSSNVDNSIEYLSQMLYSKVNANPPIESGVYAKVAVDSNGLVCGGYTLSMEDMPSELKTTISTILDTISDMVHRDQFVDVLTKVNNMPNSAPVDYSGDISALKKEIAEVKQSVNEVKYKLDKVISTLPSDQLTTTVQQLMEKISVLESRMN